MITVTRFVKEKEKKNKNVDIITTDTIMIHLSYAGGFGCSIGLFFFF